MPKFEAKVFDVGMAVIEALAFPVYREMSLKDLSEVLGMPAPKVLGLLECAQRRQWVEQMDNKRWRPAPKLTQLGDCFRRYMAEKQNDLIRLAKEHNGE